MLPIAIVIMSISTFICSWADAIPWCGVASVANSIALHQFAKLGLNTIFSPSLVHWMDTIYALAFVQNTMTTGLIAYRIWRQDRMSQGSISSSFRLIVSARVIVESASIYVLNILILIILYALNTNGQFIAQEAIVPVCGEFRHELLCSAKYQIFTVSCVSRYCVHADHSPAVFAHFNICYDYSTSRHTNKIRRLLRYGYRHDRRLLYENRPVHQRRFLKTGGAHWWTCDRQWRLERQKWIIGVGCSEGGRHHQKAQQRAARFADHIT